MQLLKQSEQHWKLRIDSEDDLWVLARFSISGRSLAMLGERRDTTTAESGDRAKAAERKKMWIQLRILTTEYKTYSNILRVHGTIEQAPIDVGSHHTHLIEVGDEIELHSLSGFPEYDRLLLEETMTSDKKSNVSIIVVENDEIVIRPMMYVALTYDHRIVDGKQAVTFLVRIKQVIENPEELLFSL